MTQASAITAIAYRDLLKLLRDPARIISTFIFPFLFIAVLGGSMQAAFGGVTGFNLLTLTFTGVLAQTLFQSTATGVISLIEDRESDFSQEIFVSPISRYSIIFGKILGETLVALPQGIAILLFGLVVGVPMTIQGLVALLPVAIIICLFGGAFGVIILANLRSQRAANQIFPFVMLPQLFIAGVFAPAVNLPPYLEIISRIAPLRYAVDLLRGVFYEGSPEYAKVVLDPPLVNLGIMAAMFVAFLALGTWLFVRGERNR
ncbi:MAG: type transport system permease protein [Chloroflexia bacterium]|jgi:ABC-2 type transport system permease protein|nr:type transport system permease protein [Chloroflexia bacterium]